MTWQDTWHQQYRPRLDTTFSGAKRGLQEGLGQRATGFDLMWQLLLDQQRDHYEIAETGTCRDPGNWKDGQSAVLFTAFVTAHGGRVRSVDIDTKAVDRARKHIASDRFSVACSDSVSWLSQQTDLDRVNLFYLDSYDVKWQDDQPSAEHHLREFQIIEPHLSAGAIVAIDDNARFLDSDRRTGKGRRIVEYLASKNKHPVYDHYQIIYQF
jgi:hypothetical protein